jgi:hypothetical protein
MRLRKFRVQGYRCIHDSGEIKVGDLAAFVGEMKVARPQF